MVVEPMLLTTSGHEQPWYGLRRINLATVQIPGSSRGVSVLCRKKNQPSSIQTIHNKTTRGRNFTIFTISWNEWVYHVRNIQIIIRLLFAQHWTYMASATLCIYAIIYKSTEFTPSNLGNVTIHSTMMRIAWLVRSNNKQPSTLLPQIRDRRQHAAVAVPHCIAIIWKWYDINSHGTRARGIYVAIF